MAKQDGETPAVGESVSRLTEVIREKSSERLEIWKNTVKRVAQNQDLHKFLSAAVNTTVGSYIKLSAEAIKGQTIEGQELTPIGRIMDAFIVGTGLGGYALGATGNLPAGAASYGASWVGWGLMYGPDILTPTIKLAADAIEKKTDSNTQTLGVIRSVERGLHRLKGVFFVDKPQK